jgi:hypothetical protein
MSALSQGFNAPALGQMGVPILTDYPVLADAKIYSGALTVITSAGYATPGRAGTSTDIAVGRSSSPDIDATGLSSGDLRIQINQGAFLYDTNGTAFTIADIGSLCYVYDDHTVTKSSAGNSIAGTVYAFEAGITTKVYVYIGLAAPIAASTLTTLSNTVSAYKSNLTFPVCIPCTLSQAVTAAVVGRYLPRMSGTILAFDGQITTPATTSGKSVVLSPQISATAVTGGDLTIASTTTATLVLGKRISATAITAANTFTATQEVTIVTSAITAFTEGVVLLELFLQSN